MIRFVCSPLPPLCSSVSIETNKLMNKNKTKTRRRIHNSFVCNRNDLFRKHFNISENFAEQMKLNFNFGSMHEVGADQTRAHSHQN